MGMLNVLAKIILTSSAKFIIIELLSFDLRASAKNDFPDLFLPDINIMVLNFNP